MRFLLTLPLLLSITTAVSLIGLPLSSCRGTRVTTCNNTGAAICCQFPRGGIQVQSVLATFLQSCDIGLFQHSTSTTLCGGSTRDSDSGPSDSVCLSGGGLSLNYGGGAYWYNTVIVMCNHKMRRMDEIRATKGNTATEDHPACTSSQLPTMYAWEGGGVWVLDLTEENMEAYESLPPTNDLDEHLQNLKDFGAVWYANPRDHAGAVEILEDANND